MFGSREFTAVDIGSHAIKIARFKYRKSDINLLDTGITELPRNTLEEGKINDSSIVAGELEDVFSRLNYRPSSIVTTVSNNNLIIRNLEVPVMSESELAEAIKWEADDQLPFPVDYASLDYIKLDREDDKINVLLVAVKQDIVDSFLAPFNKIGLRPRVVNVQPMALLSILEYQEELTEPVAIINVGAGSTQVTIGTENNIHLSRTVGTGGYEFTEILMEGKGYSYKEAEEYKIENGLNPAEDEGESTDEINLESLQLTAADMGSGSDAFSNLAGNMADEISRSLEFFSMKNRGRKINKIFMTGGGAKLKGLRDVIGREIGREIKYIDTFWNLIPENKQAPDAEIFSVAVGLGLSEVLARES